MGKLRIIVEARILTVLGLGVAGLLLVSYLVANLLRGIITPETSITVVLATALLATMVGVLLTGFLCLLVYHAFSFFMSTTLPQAIRLNEAMRMLRATTNRENRATLKFYDISVFKAERELGENVEENVRCKIISTFLAPWALRSHQDAAFGSAFHCCDLAKIQEIINSNRAKWSGATELSDDASAEVAALERKIADLLKKKKEATENFTAASGREGRLKKQLAEVESHMAVLVELANKVTNEVKPPRNITEPAVRAKYLAIGKIYGISKIPGAYVEIFRKNMPKEIINWGGAPNQGSDDKET
jgi:predicted metal-binding transcription factor (methanogenesis marker protein 9)